MKWGWRGGEVVGGGVKSLLEGVMWQGVKHIELLFTS